MPSITLTAAYPAALLTLETNMELVENSNRIIGAFTGAASRPDEQCFLQSQSYLGGDQRTQSQMLFAASQLKQEDLMC